MPCRSIVVSEYGPPENLVLTEKELPALQAHQVIILAAFLPFSSARHCESLMVLPPRAKHAGSAVVPSSVACLTVRPARCQVLVKVEAAGVNPSDTYQRLGPDGPWSATPHLLPKLPYTPGKDSAGTVEALGPGVTKFGVGDRVYTNGSVTGTFAEYAVCGVEQCFRLPDNISFAQGAGVGVPCATANRAIWQRGGLRPTEALVVHGASGAVGLAAVQMAVAAGCFVCGTAGSAAGEAAVAAAGAQCVVNHKTEGYLAEAKAALEEGKKANFKQWKKRGVSTVALVKDKTSGNVLIRMRSENGQQLLLNDWAHKTKTTKLADKKLTMITADAKSHMLRFGKQETRDELFECAFTIRILLFCAGPATVSKPNPPITVSCCPYGNSERILRSLTHVGLGALCICLQLDEWRRFENCFLLFVVL